MNRAGVVFTVAILLRLPLLFTTPLLSDDIYRYLWDGRVQQAGINPYLYPPSAPELEHLRDQNHALINHPDLRTVYPPLAEGVFRVGAAIHPSIGMQKIIFTLFDLATVMVLLLFLKFRERSLWWAVIYAWNPLTVIEFAGSGHNDSLMIFLLVMGCYFYAKGQHKMSVAMFAAATLAKWIPLCLIPWLLFQRDRREIFIYGLVVILGCIPFAQGVWTMAHSLTPALSGLSAYTRDWVFNPSIYGLVAVVMPDPIWRRVLIGSALVIFSFWWAQKHRADPVLYLFGCLYLLLLLGPVVHPWYVTWIVPFLCFIPLWSGIAWSGVVLLSYVVLIRYRAEGVWQLPLWVSLVEYGVVYGLLAKEARQWLSPSSSPR